MCIQHSKSLFSVYWSPTELVIMKEIKNCNQLAEWIVLGYWTTFFFSPRRCVNHKQPSNSSGLKQMISTHAVQPQGLAGETPLVRSPGGPGTGCTLYVSATSTWSHQQEMASALFLTSSLDRVHKLVPRTIATWQSRKSTFQPPSPFNTGGPKREEG